MLAQRYEWYQHSKSEFIYIRLFSSYGSIWKQCTEWPQVALNIERSKITQTCSISTHQVPNFIPLRSKTSALRMNYPKMTLNTTRSKIIHVILSLPDPKFKPFCPTGCQFRVACHFEKGAPNHPKFTFYTKRPNIPNI